MSVFKTRSRFFCFSIATPFDFHIIALYPFYKEDSRHFHEKLLQVVNQVLDADLPKVEEVTPATVRKARRMLTINVTFAGKICLKGSLMYTVITGVLKSR